MAELALAAILLAAVALLPTPAAAASVIATIPYQGSLPFASMEVNSQTDRLYVSEWQNGSVAVVDTVTNTIVDRITVLRPSSIELDPETNRVFVASSSDDGTSATIEVIDGPTNTVVDSWALPGAWQSGSPPLAFNAATDELYAGVQSPEAVVVIDATDGSLTGQLQLDGRSGSNIAVDASRNLAYVLHGKTVFVVDGATYEIVATISFSGPSFSSYGMALDAEHQRLYVSTWGSGTGALGTVSMIDTASRTALGSVIVGDDPMGLAVNSLTRRVYSVATDTPYLHVIDGRNLSIIDRVTYAYGVQHVAVDQKTHRVYAAAQSSIFVFDDLPSDTGAPIVNGTTDRAPNAAGWFNDDVTIDWTAADPEPSAGQPDPNTAQTLASTEGQDVVHQSPEFCDGANNCATGELALSIDKTAPTTGTPTFSVNPKAMNEQTQLTATASDGLSGVVGGEYFLDADPGEGNGVAMTRAGGTLSATIGTGLAPGVYSVGVRARDAADNWAEPSRAYLVIYDPTGGFATGGGWITPGGGTSDPGDLLPGLDGTSKANFGFVVKYQTGTSTVPGGNLEFHYNVSKFHLRSAGMDWLVVTNQNWAKFQGMATVDGADGLYPFRVDARDGDPLGQPDRFVIKVWAPGANPDTDESIYKASGNVQGQVKIHR